MRKGVEGGGLTSKLTSLSDKSAVNLKHSLKNAFSKVVGVKAQSQDLVPFPRG